MRRLVFLHGFTQTHHHWHSSAVDLARRLARPLDLAFVDLPGHGLASSDCARDASSIGGRLASLVGAGVYVGYSLGGRMALLGAAHPRSSIERLVLIGASPGLPTAAEREARCALDRARAERVTAVGVAAFVDEWLAMPMFQSLPADDIGRRRRLANTADGLAHSLRCYGTGAQPSLHSAVGQIAIPTLVIAGELDTKFVEIGRHLAVDLARGDFVSIPNAGHAAHLEQPEVTNAIIADWLTSE